jgi:pimeloyl-ACP methyl ester carboxylesterase
LAHGTDNDPDSWPNQLAALIEDELGSNAGKWKIVPFDWSEAARTRSAVAINGLDSIIDAIRGEFEEVRMRAIDQGIRIGTQIEEEGYTDIHLYGHSNGAWLIQAIAAHISDSKNLMLTFFDPYTPWGILGVRPWGDEMVLGEGADWAESYMHYGFPPDTNSVLSMAYNFDITHKFDGSLLDFREHHAWPHKWYRLSGDPQNDDITHGFGLPKSLALVQDVEDLLFLQAGLGEVDRIGLPDFVVETPTAVSTPPVSPDLFDIQYVDSNSGTVEFPSSGEILLEPSSPVWVTLFLPIDGPVNRLRFKTEFSGQVNSRNLISLEWDNMPFAVFDEEAALEGPQQRSVMLPDVYATGEHKLSYRVDTFGAGGSSVSITEIELDFVGIVEPAPIRNMVVDGVEATLTWGTKLGFDYQVEGSNDLLEWLPEGGLVEGTGNDSSLARPVVAKRFYRVRTLAKEGAVPLP